MKEYHPKNDATPALLYDIMDELNDNILKLKIELISIQEYWNSIASQNPFT